MKPVICFDMGGTLVRFEQKFNMYNALSNEFDIPEENIRHFIKSSISILNCDKKQASLKIRCYFELPKESENIIECLIARKADFTLFDDTIDTLNLLKQREYNLIVMSNAISFRTYSLEEMGLSDYISHAAYSFDYGYTKPQQQFFSKVEKNIHISNGQGIIMIGDSLNEDVCGAINAGWSAIYLNRKNKQSVNCRQVNTLRELLCLFQ